MRWGKRNENTDFGRRIEIKEPVKKTGDKLVIEA